LRTEGAVDGVGDLGRDGPARDRSVAVDGAGDFGRGALRTEGAMEGVGVFVRDGPAAALLTRAADFLVAAWEAAPAGDLEGDFGLVVARGIADGVVDAVSAELVEAVSAEAAGGFGRVNSGRIGPLICLAGRVEGVGLALFLALILTLGPCLAAVGLLALALPGKGAVAGPETDRAVDLALVTDEVEAELLRRNRLRPGASTGTGGPARSVDGRETEES
jgi:hypothetical protein